MATADILKYLEDHRGSFYDYHHLSQVCGIGTSSTLKNLSKLRHNRLVSIKRVCKFAHGQRYYITAYGVEQ